VELGTLDADNVHTPGIYVNAIFFRARQYERESERRNSPKGVEMCDILRAINGEGFQRRLAGFAKIASLWFLPTTRRTSADGLRPKKGKFDGTAALGRAPGPVRR